MSAPAPRARKFGFDFSELPAVQCWLCRHASAESDVPICAAFPGGIPPEIRKNEVDHRRPWIDPETGEPGDRGVPLERSITFEPAEGVHELALKALYRHLDGLPGR